MKELKKFLATLILVSSVFFCFSSVVFASDDLDSLTTEVETEESVATEGNHEVVNKAITDYVQGYQAVTDSNMAVANKIASPIVNIIGNLIGILTILAIALVPLTTVIDLVYIGFPAARPWLNPEYNLHQGAGVAMGGMPMGGGYGMRGGYGMGMGGMGAMGMQQQQAPASNRPRLVSDEAIACTPQTSQAQPIAGTMGGIGAMNMQMGMAAPQQPPVKSFIFEYLKKRTFFIVLFIVAIILLTSSVLTDCGINMAQLVANIISKFNNAVAGTSF